MWRNFHRYLRVVTRYFLWYATPSNENKDFWSLNLAPCPTGELAFSRGNHVMLSWVWRCPLDGLLIWCCWAWHGTKSTTWGAAVLPSLFHMLLVMRSLWWLGPSFCITDIPDSATKLHILCPFSESSPTLTVVFFLFSAIEQIGLCKVVVYRLAGGL